MGELVLIRKAPLKLNPYIRPKVLSQVCAISDFVGKWRNAEEAHRGDEVAEIVENLVTSPLAHLPYVDSPWDVEHLILDGPLQWVETLYTTWPFKGLARREDPDNAHGLLIVAAQDIQLVSNVSYEESSDAWKRLRQVLDFGLGPTLNIR